jgi:Antibiotic biosynthesis monooxygenase
VYGTVARMKIQRERVDELRTLMDSIETRPIEGYHGSHLLIPDDGRDEVVLVVYFDDKASYMKNADDPRMHEDYLKYRALLDADPEWTDGEWVTYEP